MKIANLLFVFLISISCINCSRKIKGDGESKSEGSVSDGELIDGRKFPWKGDNFKYFSRSSYYLLNRA